MRIKVAKSRRHKHSIMANGGQWSEVKIIRKGEKRLSIMEQYQMTIEEAMRSWSEAGVPITTC